MFVDLPKAMYDNLGVLLSAVQKRQATSTKWLPHEVRHAEITPGSPARSIQITHYFDRGIFDEYRIAKHREVRISQASGKQPNGRDVVSPRFPLAALRPSKSFLHESSGGLRGHDLPNRTLLMPVHLLSQQCPSLLEVVSVVLRWFTARCTWSRHICLVQTNTLRLDIISLTTQVGCICALKKSL